MVEINERGKRKYYIASDKKHVYITDKEGKSLYFTKDFVDISYFSKNSVSCALSNLFPYEFTFKGCQAKSVEGVLQSLKHGNPEVQHIIYGYAGKDAYHTRAASFENDWRNEYYLHCGNKLIDRFDIEYQNLLNEIYIAVSSNPLFASTLRYTGDRVLLHSKGVSEPDETILTPREYIDRLTIIRSSLLNLKDPSNDLDALSEEIAQDYYQRGYIKK
jgi:hypothetical protein